MKRMQTCVAEIRLWVNHNFLKLNDAKAEFIIFGTLHDVKRVTEWTVSLGQEDVLPSTTVRNIGAMLTMESHINNVRKSCYMQIRILSKIQNNLSDEAAKFSTHAFVTYWLDNMNSLLHYLPNCQTEKLQLIQNHAVRIVNKCKKSYHITQTLIDLHWLPVKFRLQYKLLILMYKSLHVMVQLICHLF